MGGNYIDKLKRSLEHPRRGCPLCLERCLAAIFGAVIFQINDAGKIKRG
jgi:hypothetical protein